MPTYTSTVYRAATGNRMCPLFAFAWLAVFFRAAAELDFVQLVAVGQNAVIKVRQTDSTLCHAHDALDMLAHFSKNVSLC